MATVYTADSGSSLAHETGHRIGAIRKLRWSDVDFDQGRIAWRAENEKSGHGHSTLESLWIGDLTWIEVRDAIGAGKTTAIIPTGAVSEQNGPYLAGRKHDIILSATAPAIVGKLGNTLIAPIVGFVPEGDWDVPFGTQGYPGTIGVSDATFEAILTDVTTSLRAMGFERIILIGDSGGNQAAPGARRCGAERKVGRRQDQGLPHRRVLQLAGAPGVAP